ncbi:hypothetical protein [Agromyces marinus]|uniref:Uncharacterized protein n=1 Tax=Agromyces marinus TaxID=1389020 RepID=A0ABM8H3U9_9MICO|nr:hypothetical protein [Agromyces marinus]UIP59472.1 hypothetical protein DSM26151_23790 [Agromyces marinus]BDZ55482.1 hypothetical protein GCM10025870_25550 [Agromyces marinus]
MHPTSPRGRAIRHLHGDASTIVSRGDQIERLGDDMIESAALLRDIADGAAGQRGLAMDELREVVGEVHVELRRAGEMYRPTGPVVRDYGTAVAEIKPRLDTRADACEELWQDYLRAPGYREGERPSFLTAVDADGSEAADQRALDRGKEAAYDDWLAEAQAFDREYDTWEDAFEHAARNVGDVLDGRIEDGFWDRVDGFVAGALEVLKVVGIALFIASIIVGGPLVAALSAIVAVATLVLTVYQKARGDTGWKEVILAGIAVIPFGSLGKLGSRGFADGVLGGLVTRAGRSAIRSEVGAVFGSGSAAFRFTGSGVEALRNGFSHAVRNHGTDGRLVDSLARFFTGKASGALASGKPADIVVSTLWTHLGRINTGLSWGTGQGLWSRAYDGVVGTGR